MGFLDKLTGTRRPAPGTPRSTPEELLAALIAVGGPDDPYRVFEGGRGDADLTAEWRLDEPRWSTVFEQRDVHRLVQITMRIASEAGEVRSLDRAVTVTWSAGVAQLSFTKEFKRGQINEMSFRGELSPAGYERTWSFSTLELKEPLRRAALDHGWGWKGVTFGRL